MAFGDDHDEDDDRKVRANEYINNRGIHNFERPVLIHIIS